MKLKFLINYKKCQCPNFNIFVLDHMSQDLGQHLIEEIS